MSENLLLSAIERPCDPFKEVRKEMDEICQCEDDARAAELLEKLFKRAREIYCYDHRAMLYMLNSLEVSRAMVMKYRAMTKIADHLNSKTKNQ